MDLVSRFYVCLISLDPAKGSEIRKTRPCLVVSPDSMNSRIRTLIVAPLTSTSKPWPTRVPCNFDGRSGHVALDQIRTIDKSRIVRILGRMDPASSQAVLDVLQEIFAD
jgi:mRNA interferase MazF